MEKWNVKEGRLDQLMYVSPLANRTWQPRHFMDLRYGWDEAYINKYAQPFSAFNFAKNCSAVLGASGSGLSQTLVKMAKYLDFIASQSIEDRRGDLLVVNDFEFPMMWVNMGRGFLGSFQNAYTAYGYIHLSEATGNAGYLKKARDLLSSIVRHTDVPLSGFDDRGDFWLYEYVFRAPDEAVEYLAEAGMRPDAARVYRAPVYNGHIHTLFAFVRYAVAAKSAEFDQYISAAIDTMRNRLPDQAHDDRFFSYMAVFPLLPDYGQKRAVELATGLVELRPEDRDLGKTVEEMRSLYETKIANDVVKIFDEARNNARKVHLIVRDRKARRSTEVTSSE